MRGSAWLSERDDWKFMVQQLQETRAQEARENEELKNELRRAELTIAALKSTVSSFEAAANMANSSSSSSSFPPSALIAPLPSDDGLLISSLRSQLLIATETIAEKERQILSLTSPPTEGTVSSSRLPFKLLKSYYSGSSALLPITPRADKWNGGGTTEKAEGAATLQLAAPSRPFSSLYAGVTTVLSYLLTNEGQGSERIREAARKTAHDRDKENDEGAPVMIL
jgi:hypothetical protein